VKACAEHIADLDAAAPWERLGVGRDATFRLADSQSSVDVGCQIRLETVAALDSLEGACFAQETEPSY
jgi:hypothetical protein